VVRALDTAEFGMRDNVEKASCIFLAKDVGFGSSEEESRYS
jgi:hypothetical protein